MISRGRQTAVSFFTCYPSPKSPAQAGDLVGKMKILEYDLKDFNGIKEVKVVEVF